MTSGPMSDCRAGGLESELETFVGKPLGGEGPHLAPDPVNVAMIRHWAAAFEDPNPVYTDPDRAAASRFGGIVAPPAMLQTWTMATPRITGMAERGGSPVEQSPEGIIPFLDRAGFTGTLASNSEFQFERYLVPGERISSEAVVESVSDEKQTRMGPGYFVTWVTTYRVAEGSGGAEAGGEVVGRHRFRILKFRPSTAGGDGR